jgi:hypothetical protein
MGLTEMEASLSDFEKRFRELKEELNELRRQFRELSDPPREP